MKKKLTLDAFKVNSFVTELKDTQQEDLKGASCLMFSCNGGPQELDDCHVEPK